MSTKKGGSFFRNNGLSLVLFGLFFFTFLIGQSVVGHLEHNSDQQEHGQPQVTYLQYLATDHFLEATMENWESEFLQKFFFVTGPRQEYGQTTRARIRTALIFMSGFTLRAYRSLPYTNHGERG